MHVIIKSRLKVVRKNRGVSIRQLSNLTGISKTYISDVENDHKIPTLYTLCLMASALHVKPEELYSYKAFRD